MELEQMLSELCTAPLNVKFKSGCDIDEVTSSLNNWRSSEVKMQMNDTKLSPTLFESLSEWLRIGFEIYDQKQQQPGQNAKGDIVYQVKFFGGNREQNVEFSISDSMVIDEQNNITAMSQHQKYEQEYLQNNMELDSQAAPSVVTPSEAFNHNFLPANELMHFLCYSLPIIDKSFQEHELDTLGFFINLFNYDISSCRLSIQQNADKSYVLYLTASQLVDPNEGISLSEFYTALADINHMAQLSDQISALFVSINHSSQNISRNSPQDLAIEDLIVMQMQRIKSTNKKLAAEKQELIESFENQLQ